MGTFIGWAATRNGYAVQTCVDGEVVDEYSGGNNPYDSIQRLHPDDPDVPLLTLKRYAKQTALETADDLGVSRDNVGEDDDLKTALEDNEPLERE